MRVYTQLKLDYPALVETLKETITLKENSNLSKDRQAAKVLSKLLKTLTSKKFVLELSAVCDIYSVFKHGVNLLQIVNMLPHDRFDQFTSKCVDVLKSMPMYNDHEKCAKDSCMWPLLHEDESTLKSSNKYRGINLDHTFPINIRLV